MRVDTLLGFVKGFVFFLILYIQAQVHRHYVFPLFIKRKFRLYAFITIGSLLAGSLLLYAANYYWIEPELYRQTSIEWAVVYHFVICVGSTITMLSLFVATQYSAELQQRYHQQVLLSEMNMKYLHAQLNPHFFFNMLNNLYGVSLSEPARTPDLILKLASLMRYQLENGNKNEVTIKEELNFIENYIVMERERIGKRCDISFEYPSNDSRLATCQIAPLILITMVENAFKHSLTVTSHWFVSIRVKLEDEALIVDIRNSLPDQSLKNTTTGIGLQNIRQRLELLYKGNYHFSANEEAGVYETCLRINLNSL